MPLLKNWRGLFGDTRGGDGLCLNDKTFLIQQTQVLAHAALKPSSNDNLHVRNRHKGFDHTVTFLSWPLISAKDEMACIGGGARDIACSRFSNPAARWSRLRCDGTRHCRHKGRGFSNRANLYSPSMLLRIHFIIS
jgi:hypothetical protein